MNDKRANIMTEKLQAIKVLINDGRTSFAIEQLRKALQTEPEQVANIYYLLGNAFRKEGNWQEALNNYQMAISIDPNNPAQEARSMVLDILNYYNKDMYNQ